MVICGLRYTLCIKLHIQNIINCSTHTFVMFCYYGLAQKHAMTVWSDFRKLGSYMTPLEVSNWPKVKMVCHQRVQIASSTLQLPLSFHVLVSKQLGVGSSLLSLEQKFKKTSVGKGLK